MPGPSHDKNAPAMSAGAELAAARERLGLSREDLSQRTKISVDRLLAIEQQDGANLPPLVYLKGFVREYATAVKLDPEEMTSRFLGSLDDPAALISVDTDLTQTIPVDSLAAMESFPAETPGDGPPGTTAPGPILEFAYEPVAPLASAPEPPRVEEATVTPPPRRVIKKVFLEDDDDLPSLQGTVAAAASFPIDPPHFEPSAPSGPLFAQMRPAPATRFRGGFMAVALAVLAGILIAAYGEKLGVLYPLKAPSTADARAKASPAPLRPDAAPASRASDNPTAESPARAANDQPSERPPAPTPDAPVVEPAPSATAPPPRVTTPPASPPVSADRTATPATPPAPPSPAAVTNAPPAASAAPAGAAPVHPSPLPSETEREPATPTSTDLTGDWSWTTRIEATDVAAFENMNLGFRLQLKQNGERITGRGLKWMENGKLIPERSRTPIIIEGERRGNRLELRFTEHGAARRSSGTFVMDVGADGTLHGQF